MSEPAVDVNHDAGYVPPEPTSDADLLKLAREDFNEQEKLSASLPGRTQFIIAVLALLANASVVLLGAAQSRKMSGIMLYLSLAAFLAFWAFSFRAGVALVGAINVKKYSHPHAMDKYTAWQAGRAGELLAMGYTLTVADAYARWEMIRFMWQDYGKAAGENRELNLSRQERIADASKIVVFSAVPLVFQAVLFGMYILSIGGLNVGQ